MNAQIISRIKREIHTMKMFRVRAVAGPTMCIYIYMYIYTTNNNNNKKRTEEIEREEREKINK